MSKTAVLGQLAVNLTLNSAKFNSELRKSNKRANNWGKKMRGTVNTAGKAFGAMAITAAAGLAVLYSKNAKVIDELGKMSDRLNFTTDKLAAYHHITELNGESSESFDRSIEKMVRSIGEFERGMGTAKPALEKLGISMDSLKNKKADEQFKIIANEIRGLESQTLKASIASDIFGRKGIRLLNTINQSEEAFAAAQKEVEIFGLNLSRIDVAKVEQSNDAGLRLGKMWDGLGQQLTVKFAPIVTAVTNKLFESSKAAGGMGKVAQRVFKGAVRAAGFLADMVRGLEVTFAGLKVVTRAVIFGLTGGFVKVLEVLASVGNAIVDGLVWPFKNLLELLAPFSDDAKEALGGLDNIVEGFKVKIPEGMKTFVAAQQEAFTQSKKEFHDLAMQEMPSDKFGKWVDEVIVMSEEAARKLAANAPAKIIAESAIDPKLQEKLAKNFERVQQFLADKQTLETQAFENRQTITNEYFDSLEVPNEERRNLVLQGLKEKHEKAMLGIQTKSMGQYQSIVMDLHKWEVKSTEDKIKSTISLTKSVLGPLENTSKTAFKIIKASKIGEAIMNAYSAINTTMSSLPYPMNIVASTLVGIKAFANVKAIKAQKFRSSANAPSVVPIGGVGNLNAKAAPTAPDVPTVEDQQDARNRKQDNFQSGNIGNTYNIYAEGYEGNKMGEGIRQYVEGGGLIIPAGTRQEEELQGAA